MSALRENWRIALLIVIVIASGAAFLVPGVPPGTAGNATSPTNLQYGIQLDGGTSIQAPPVGVTAEGVTVPADGETALEQNVSSRLGIDEIDVRVDNGTETVEAFNRTVSQSDLRAALEAEGYQPETVRDGVTEFTRGEMVRVIEDKIRESALGSGTVSTVQTPGGQHFISITAPDRDRDELRSLIDERGVVRVYAVYPGGNDTHVSQQVLEQDEFSRIGAAQEDQNGNPVVPVTVRDSSAPGFQQSMVDAGFGRRATCTVEAEGRSIAETTEMANGTGQRCLVATLNGNVVFAGGVRQNLASSFSDGTFANDPNFQMSTRNMSEARELSVSLRAGRLPAPLNFEEARSTSLEPALAERFRVNSLITGIAAVIAVSLVVYARYGDPRVALPMIVTALSEVWILLGFVAFVQYPLNLSHIAGFVAVIGTGVDDLIIIADEILQQGQVATGRIFQNRFRKAFWVIGAAAATTIVAMSPLTVLGLGDLTGFAIVTIVGVLIGVLITRPAYGDILRNLVLDEEQE
jgi:preprotein translocase subunit SecD